MVGRRLQRFESRPPAMFLSHIRWISIRLSKKSLRNFDTHSVFLSESRLSNDKLTMQKHYEQDLKDMNGGGIDNMKIYYGKEPGQEFKMLRKKR